MRGLPEVLRRRNSNFLKNRGALLGLERTSVLEWDFRWRLFKNIPVNDPRFSIKSGKSREKNVSDYMIQILNLELELHFLVALSLDPAPAL